MKHLILVGFMIACGEAMVYLDVMFDEWNLFKLTHGKQYQNDIDEKYRMKIFLDNKRKILRHNAKYARGEVSYELALNHFADLLTQEFTAIRNGFNRSLTGLCQRNGSTFILPSNVDLPKYVDWRAKGAVTAVKDQGKCASCWAFSAIGSLEGQHFRKTGKLVSLSEQNLIDCSTAYGNYGCNGGNMDNSFRYIRENQGVATEKSYPYKAEDDQCKFKVKDLGATNTGYVVISVCDETNLKAAVATAGPISAAIVASHESFQFYHKGVYFEPECISGQPDHGILVVGYGTSDNGDDYWLVKNSWGSFWGDEGYVKMARNRNNSCGIASSGSFPLV